MSMDADLLAMLEDGVARFSRERYSRAQWKAYGAEPDAYRLPVWREMAELGWFSLVLPDEGNTHPLLANVLPLFKGAGAALWREPLLGVLAESASLLLDARHSGSDDGLLDAIVEGLARPAFADREANPASRDGLLSTVAAAEGGAYRLNGEKTCVPAALTSTGLIVSARIAGTDEPASFLLLRDEPGVTLRPYRTLDDRGAAAIRFEGARARLLVRGEAALRRARARGAALAAVETAGLLRSVVDATADHMRQRRQFGRTLSSFQVLQHRLVDMYLHYRESLALAHRVVEAVDRNEADLPRQLLMVRAQIAAAGRFVTQQAIQLHGGMGMTDELAVGDYYKRVLMLESLYGSADWALSRMAA
ncbi:Acyl-CoA dehydrogenase [Solimonas aquatica]|uniref:Acyl-CoA dehydrogenase n=1 Tax=Solimonas aquatica TaxID=489703 RepID=A0A1H9LIG4_9GAMM|nr:acyl-CoA dehydrogenase [Solimonas aquatica]SER11168.1 Acyl-CoA dehydrogenase [Solimonas aquatica]